MTKSTGVLPPWRRIRWLGDRYAVVVLDEQASQFLLAEMLDSFDSVSAPAGGAAHGVLGSVRQHFFRVMLWEPLARSGVVWPVYNRLLDHFRVRNYHR